MSSTPYTHTSLNYSYCKNLNAVWNFTQWYTPFIWKEWTFFGKVFNKSITETATKYLQHLYFIQKAALNSLKQQKNNFLIETIFLTHSNNDQHLSTTYKIYPLLSIILPSLLIILSCFTMFIIKPNSAHCCRQPKPEQHSSAFISDTKVSLHN